MALTQQEQTRLYKKTINLYGPKIHREFVEALREYQDQLKINALVKGLENGDIDEALKIEQFGALLLGDFWNITQDEFSKSGNINYNLIPKASITSRFDIFNPLTVDFMQDYKLNLIREITSVTKEATREILIDGLENGKSIPQMANSIKQRVGLTSSQMRAVINYENQLRAGSNLNFTPVDQRRINAIDRRIANRQIREGGLSNERINGLVDRYQKSLTNRRALNIARTESHRAFNQGQLQAWQQAIENDTMPANAKKKWRFVKDERTRPDHRAVARLNPNGVKINESFQTLSGPVSGPPLGVNCRCTMLIIFE